MPFDLADYDHLLLDMNGTFLFDFDCFGPGEDFGATYARLGYTALAPAEAHRHVRAAYDYMAVRYIDEAYYAAFPGVAAALRDTTAAGLPASTVGELVDTFAVHELGVLPQGHRDALEALARTHTLSVLSNLWAPKDRWLARFEELGITPLFTDLHFSSDGPEMKPHPTFFGRALDAVRARQPDARVLYIGDSYRCDVLGALGVGIDSAWLSAGAPEVVTQGQPVAIYDDLVSLAEAHCAVGAVAK